MSPDVPPVPDGSAIITPNMQYAELQELRKSVDKLVATVDPAFADVRKDVQDVEQRVTAQQVQIDGLNRWRNMLTGALVLLSSLVAYGLLNLADLGIGGK